MIAEVGNMAWGVKVLVPETDEPISGSHMLEEGN